MAKKLEKDEFLVITLKHAPVRKVIVNHPRTPQLWAIGNENDHKTRK